MKTVTLFFISKKHKLIFLFSKLNKSFFIALIAFISIFYASVSIAGVPYNAIVTGMVFISKDDAQTFYDMTKDGDDEGRSILMTTCILNATCLIVEEGNELFLEEQANYPLIKIRIKGYPQKYWALNNIIGFE